MHITDITMWSTFDKIIRKDLIEILENIMPEDEVKMARLLLSSIHLDIKIKVIETESFQSHKGSPQGDCISGTFFDMYLEDSLRHARCKFNLKKNIDLAFYSKAKKCSLPKEIVYADGTDFIFKTKEEKNNMIEIVNAVFTSRNLLSLLLSSSSSLLLLSIYFLLTLK